MFVTIIAWMFISTIVSALHGVNTFEKEGNKKMSFAQLYDRRSRWTYSVIWGVEILFLVMALSTIQEHALKDPVETSYRYWWGIASLLFFTIYSETIPEDGNKALVPQIKLDWFYPKKALRLNYMSAILCALGWYAIEYLYRFSLLSWGVIQIGWLGDFFVVHSVFSTLVLGDPIKKSYRDGDRIE